MLLRAVVMGVGVVPGRGVVVRKSGYDGMEFRARKAREEKLFELIDVFLKNDSVSLQKDILDHVEYTLWQGHDSVWMTWRPIRDRLIERWHDTHQYVKKQDLKQVYFLSLEFLMGRSLTNSVINLGIKDQYADALNQLGFEFELLAEQLDGFLSNSRLLSISMGVFIPDYNVSVAELVIPGHDLSHHISTAGHEASRTGSVKALMNGCLLLATADGSTVEIIEEVRADNMFIFGAKLDEVPALREKGASVKAPLQLLEL